MSTHYNTALFCTLYAVFSSGCIPIKNAAIQEEVQRGSRMIKGQEGQTSVRQLKKKKRKEDEKVWLSSDGVMDTTPGHDTYRWFPTEGSRTESTGCAIFSSAYPNNLPPRQVIIENSGYFPQKRQRMVKERKRRYDFILYVFFFPFFLSLLINTLSEDSPFSHQSYFLANTRSTSVQL